MFYMGFFMKSFFFVFLLIFASAQTVFSEGGKKCQCNGKNLMLPTHSVIKLVKVGTSLGKMNTAGYVTLLNKKDYPISLSAVSFENPAEGFCESIEIHTHELKGDRAEMKKVDALTIPAKTSLQLKSGGDHIMFMKLKRDLMVNEEVNLILRVTWDHQGEKGSKDIRTTFKVLSPEAIDAVQGKSTEGCDCE